MSPVRRGRKGTWGEKVRFHHKSSPGVTATWVPELSFGGRQGLIRLSHPILPDKHEQPYLSRPRSRKPSNPPYLKYRGRGPIDQAPDWEALILMSTPAGRLSLLRASIVLLVG